MDNEPKDAEYEVATTGEVSPMLNDRYTAAIARTIDASKKIKGLVLARTSPGDWDNISGKPYLNAHGVREVRQLFNVNFTNLEVEVRRLEDEKGEMFEQYIAKVTAEWRGGVDMDEGVASTNEPFFSTRQGAKIPFSEVNIADVRKAAITNAKSRVLKSILGFGDIDWDDINQKKESARAGWDYGKKPSPPPQKKEAPSSGNIDDLKKKADALLEEIVCMEGYSGGDDPQGYERAQDILEEVSSFTSKEGKLVKGPRDLTDKRWSVKWLQKGVIPSLKKKLEELQSGPPEPGSEG